MGSQVVAAFIAFWTFWVLLPYGYAIGELSPTQIVVFLLLWIGGRLALAHVPWLPFSSFVAVLDIALVFAIFKGDVRLS